MDDWTQVLKSINFLSIISKTSKWLLSIGLTFVTKMEISKQVDVKIVNLTIFFTKNSTNMQLCSSQVDKGKSDI